MVNVCWEGSFWETARSALVSGSSQLQARLSPPQGLPARGLGLVENRAEETTEVQVGDGPAGRTGCIPAPDIGAGWGQAPRAGLGGTDVKYVNKGGRLSASSLLASPPQAEYMPASPPPGSLAKTEDRRSQGPVLAGGGLGVFLE